MSGHREDADAILDAVLDGVHASWPKTDIANRRHVWGCTCEEFVVYQPFGAGVPAELISHQQGSGQMRGEAP